MKSAKELLSFNHFDANGFARRAPQPIVIPQKSLEILEEIIKNHNDRGTELPDREDLRQIYHSFITADRIGKLRTEFDTLKRTRQLAWALTYSEGRLPRIVDTPELRDALQLIENRFRVSTLPGVFNALLEAWDTPNAGRLRAFVKKHLTDYNGSRKFVQKLKANIAWYCEKNSATQLALHLMRSRVKLSVVWSVLELPDHMHSYSYFGAVAEAYIALNRHVDQETAADVIEFVEKHNNDKTSRAVLSKLIESLGYGVSEHVRQPVQSYALREWGDRESLAGMCVGAMSLIKQNRFLRGGLLQKISVSSLMSLPKPATITSLPTEKRFGWRILNIFLFVVRCCVKMLNICLETIRKPLNTTKNDVLPH